MESNVARGSVGECHLTRIVSLLTEITSNCCNVTWPIINFCENNWDLSKCREDIAVILDHGISLGDILLYPNKSLGFVA